MAQHPPDELAARRRRRGVAHTGFDFHVDGESYTVRFMVIGRWWYIALWAVIATAIGTAAASGIDRMLMNIRQAHWLPLIPDILTIGVVVAFGRYLWQHRVPPCQDPRCPDCGGYHGPGDDAA